MAIKVALFFEDEYWENHNRRRYGEVLMLIRTFGFYDKNLEMFEPGRNEVVEHTLSGMKFDCDAAVIHMSYEVKAEKDFTLFSSGVFQKLLPESTRRLVIGQQRTGSVSNEIIDYIGADHYFPRDAIHEPFLQALRLGRVDGSEIALRGYQIRDEEGAVIKRVRPLAPDREVYDENYFKKAKER